MTERFLAGFNLFYEESLANVSREHVSTDLQRVAGWGARAVRILLPWKDLQPEKDKIPHPMLRQVEWVLDQAVRSSLQVIPVFFCGGLKDTHWLPPWMCESTQPVPSPRDFYRERDLIRAQQLQVRVVAGAFAQHEAVLAWDLGRQTSLLAVSPDPDAARSRLLWILEALRKEDGDHRVTFTLSQADLEEDRGLRPSGIAEELDFLSIEMDLKEISWREQTDDVEAAGFLCELAASLSRKPVMVSELVVSEAQLDGQPSTDELLESVRRSGALGAFLRPEAGGSVAESLHRYASSSPERIEKPARRHIDEDGYYAAPKVSLVKAYRSFREGHYDR